MARLPVVKAAVVLLVAAVSTPAAAGAQATLEADGSNKRTATPNGPIAVFGRVPFQNGSRIEASEMSPDGKMLATLSARSLTIWDAVTGQTLHRFYFDIPGRFSYERGLAFSPDSKRLACRPTSGQIVVWDLPSCKELRRFQGESDKYDFAFCRFAADSATLIVQLNNDVAWLNVETGVKVRQLSETRISQLSADEKTFAVIQESKRQVLIGDVQSGKITHTLPIAARSSNRERGLLFLGDGVGLAVVHHPDDPAPKYELQEIQLWDITTGKRRETTWPLANTDGREDYCLAQSADGKVLYFPQQRKGIRRYSLVTDKELEPIELNGHYLSGIFPHPDDRTLFAVDFGDIRRWDVATGKQISKDKDFIHWQHTAISRDGRWLALGGRHGGPLELCDTELRTIKRIDDPVSLGFVLGFSPDNKALAVHSNSHIRFLRIPELTEVKTEMKKFTPEDPTILQASIQFSPDGRYLASRTDTALLRLMDLTTDKKVWSQEECLWALFTPDSKRILTISRDKQVMRLHEIATQKIHFEIAQPQVPYTGRRNGPRVFALAFAPDGRTLALAMTGGYICLLDAATGKERFRFLCMPSARDLEGTGVPAATTLAFSADGQWLAVGGHHGLLRIWEVSTRRELHRLHGHDGATQLLCFSADGRRLVSWGDGEGLLWDLRPRGENAKGTNPLVDLLSKDGPTVYRAVWALADDPQGPAMLREKIPPKRVDARPERIALLIADLNAEQFKPRNAAMRALAELEENARPALAGALAKNPSLEMRRRIEILLSELDTPTEPALQISRAVGAMELQGSAAARKLLQDWSEGTPGLRLTEESRAALARQRMGPKSGK